VKTLVFNSTPLIYLTKAGVSRVFEQLQDKKVTSPAVKREVVDRGKPKGVPDEVVLEKLFNHEVFSVCEPVDKSYLSQLLETRGLHLADAEVLTLAYELNAYAVIDDEVARKTAKIYGIDYVGSSYLLMRAVCEGLISKAKANQAINDMISAGWRCSIESYTKIMESLEKL
jgi:predicted nucleic acid-binding protein